MFTPEYKAAINTILKETGIKNKKEVFDRINQGATYEEIHAFINQLIEEQREKAKPKILRRDDAAEHTVFGRSLITQNAIDDMDSIMTMPFVLGGALMPDCLEESAEILTPKGFVFIKDLHKGDLVANYNVDSNNIEFLPCLDVINRPVRKGEKLYTFAFGRTGKSIVFSSRHKMAHIKKMGCFAESITKNTRLGDFVWSASDFKNPIGVPLSLDEIRLIAWIIGDGNIKFTKNPKSINRRIRFNVRKERKAKRLLELLEALNLDVKYVYSYQRGYLFYLNTEESKKYIDIVTDNKEFPFEWIGNATKEQMEVLLDECIQIDGNYEKYIKDSGIQLNTTRKQDVDFFCAMGSCYFGLTHFSAYTSTGYSTKNVKYVIHIKMNGYSDKSRYYKSRVVKQRVEYSGNLVCVTVPASYFVARVNGLCFISGNSHRVAENKPPVGSVIVADAVVPAYVGSDISCSVNLTITDMAVDNEWFEQNLPSIKYVLQNKAQFGLEIQPDPVVFDQAFFKEPLELETEYGKQVYEQVKKIARNHFATCGDGNHFFEFGYVDVKPYGNLPNSGKVRNLAMLSHFGSRAVGSTIAGAYEALAAEQWEMPKGVKDAPLDPNSPDGADYIALMNWAGDFAEAGHKWLHQHLLNELSQRVKLSYTNEAYVFSRHNSMWITNDGYVHRKGATPADFGVTAIIPATMGHTTQIVRGWGNVSSFASASHGGGRTHSRGQALQEFSGTHEYVAREYGVTLIGGDADEDPRAYKNIHEVMAEQFECVTPIGGFTPKVVRMAEPRMPHWKMNKGKK